VTTKPSLIQPSRFTRHTFDVADGGRRWAVTGHRRAGWGIARHGSAWAVYHLPTGLRVCDELGKLDQAKSLCDTLEANLGGHALQALAAQPFGAAPQPGTDAYQDAVQVWQVLTVWRHTVGAVSA